MAPVATACAALPARADGPMLQPDRSPRARHGAPAVRLVLALAGVLGGMGGTAAWADTVVPGGSTGTTTWIQANSPYVVLGDLVVQSGATLTIEAGTVVTFADSDAMSAGLDIGKVELHVDGTLQVTGSASSVVEFRAASGNAAGIWHGIVVGAFAVLEMAHARIRHAVDGVRIAGLQDTPPQLESLEIADSIIGVNLLAGTATMTHCRLHSNASHAVQVHAGPTNSASVEIASCTLHGNGGAGVRVFADSAGIASAVIGDSNITANAVGLHRAGAGTTSVGLGYSNVWGNTTDLDGVTPGPGVFSANPLYVGAPDNLRITANSPSRFAGSGGNDLGALPYNGDPTQGLLGTLWTHTTLALAESPHTVTGDLTVAPSVTLTIEPGVDLLIASADAMQAGADPTRIELIVRGALAAESTAVDPVIIAATAAFPDAWLGIRLAAGASPSALAHLDVSGAELALDLASASGHALSALDIHDCGIGVRWQSGTGAMDAITVARCDTGILVTGSAGGTISNAVVQGNSGDGVAYTATAGESSLALVHATIEGNGRGVVASADGAATDATLDVQNSLVTGNAQAGLQHETGGTGSLVVTASFNGVWDNGSDYVQVAAGPGSISLDPLYLSPPDDLRVAPGSPAIDAGTDIAGVPSDRLGAPRPVDGDGIGGAGFDLGAYEAPAVDAMFADGFEDPG